MTLVHLALPSQEHRGSGCKQKFVCWPFKRVPVSLACSHLSAVDRNPAAFHSQILCCCLFPALVLRAKELFLEFRPHTSQGEFLTAEIALQILSCLLNKWGQRFLCLRPSYQSRCCFFCKSLVIRCLFSWLFRIIALHFSLIPVWPWDKVSVAFTTLDPAMFKVFNMANVLNSSMLN